MDIRLANTDEEIAEAHSVMKHLRDVDRATFLEAVRAQENSGYRIVSVYTNDGPVAVAGFRISQNLAWRRHLYIDDLVTLPEARSTATVPPLSLGWYSWPEVKGARRFISTPGLRERMPIASTSERVFMSQACISRECCKRRITGRCNRPPAAAAERPIRYADQS